MMKILGASFLLVALLASVARAETITFLQPADCAEIARWELWAQRTGEPAATKRADVWQHLEGSSSTGRPEGALEAACSETAPNVATVPIGLRRGQYAFTLRAVAVSDGETADSNILSVRFPLTKPTTQTITREDRPTQTITR